MITFKKEQIDNIFPFYISVDKDLNIFATGKSLKKLFPQLIGKPFGEAFMIKAPTEGSQLIKDFGQIIHQLVIIAPIKDPHFYLRGQFELLSYDEKWIFLGSPLFQSIEALNNLPLNSTDFAPHDPLFDLFHVLKNKMGTTADKKEDLYPINKQINQPKRANRDQEEIALFPTQNPDPVFLLELELMKAKEEAEASSRSKELFLANMSHEIRTPMNAITGMINQLHKTSLDSEQTFYLNTIHSAANNLLIILNDILDLSKIEAGKLTLEEIGFDLSEVIERVMQVMGHKAEEKGLKFANSFYDPKLAKVFLGDPYRLNQILQHLLSNAIKFTEQGSVDIACKMIEENHDSQLLNIEVKDTGVGMAKSFVKDLFHKFNQEDASITKKFGGTGLGMSICKELVELMGGNIKVESKKGKGTTVTLELKLPKGQKEDLPTEKTNPFSPEALKDKLILVTDDNEMNRLVASTILRNYGAKIIEAENGVFAISAVEKYNVDLILMDVQMPILDGIQATKVIRKKGKKDIPIIALTAFALKGDDAKFISSGMNDYLAKPFDETQLLNIVVKWLDKGLTLSTPLPNDDKGFVADNELFDLSKLEAIAPGNSSFKQNMVQLFISVSTTSLQEMQLAFEQKNVDEIKRLAHRLKPSINSMGITSLQEDIKQLELGVLSETEMGKSIGKLKSVLGQVNKALESINFK